MENQDWKIEITWIKAHAGHCRNELADQTAKEAAANRDIGCYKRNPKNRVIRKLSDNSVTKWQVEWDNTTKGAITKSFFPKIIERLKLKINVIPNFTTMEKDTEILRHICTDSKLRTTQCTPAKEEKKQYTIYYLNVNWWSRYETYIKLQCNGEKSGTRAKIYL